MDSQVYELPASERIIFNYVIGVIITFFLVLGIFLNSIIIFAFFTSRNLKSPTNILIIAIIINDLALVILGVPMDIGSSFSQQWLFNAIGCRFYGFFMFYTGLNSIAIMTVVALDRFFVIAKPILAPHITRNVIYACIGGCSVYSMTFTLPPLIGWNEYTLDRSRVRCSINFESRDPIFYSYTIVIFVFCYFLPLLINIFSYFYIYMTIRVMSRRSKAVSNQSNEQNKQAEMKMLKVSLAVFTSFIVVWTPYAIVCMWTVFGNPLSIPYMVSTTPSVWAKSMVVIYPFVFVLSNKQFRDAIIEKPVFRVFRSLMTEHRVKPVLNSSNSMEINSEIRGNQNQDDASRRY